MTDCNAAVIYILVLTLVFAWALLDGNHPRR